MRRSGSAAEPPAGGLAAQTRRATSSREGGAVEFAGASRAGKASRRLDAVGQGRGVHDLGKGPPQGGLVIVAGGNDGQHDLLVAGLGVGEPDDRGLGHPRERGDGGLVQARIDVDPVTEEHVLLPAEQDQPTLLQPDQVAGGDLLQRLLAEIALGEVGAGDEQLAVVRDPDADAGKRRAEQVPLGLGQLLRAEAIAIGSASVIA